MSASFPAGKHGCSDACLPPAAVRFAFAERREEVLDKTIGIAHDVVAAYASHLRQPEISLNLPVDRRCYPEELPPDLVASWTQFAAMLARIDREGRVAWGRAAHSRFPDRAISP